MAYYVKDGGGPTWKQATTLEQYLVKLIQERSDRKEEFTVAVKYWGYNKLEEVWNQHKERVQIQKQIEESLKT